ncbi:alpha/beta fold hydrolase [Listeria sp. PSOL-1]|uniref:alpha/beta fold hydrolase n=1 Tax=Listeria sp. PSOL-1 TaxID=1844999 RepID=UPI0013D0911D|nr:alpha/beta fold hydrolase [Listeria sp. PSOL-1]
MDYIEIKGKQIHTVELNPSGEETVIMLHGLFTNLSLYYMTIGPELAKKKRVILYDLRGHGMSEWNEEGFSIAALSEELIKIMDFYHVNSAELIGYSYGAATALYAAITYPTRVKSLTLIDAPLFNEDFFKNLTLNSKEMLQTYKKSTKIPINNKSTERAEKKIDKILQQGHLEEAISTSQQLLTEEKISAIKKPVLLLYGTRSSFAQTGKRLKELIPHSQLNFVAGDHNFPVKKGKWLIQKITNFLSKQDKPAFLKLNNIQKSYYLNKEEFPVLKGVNLQIGHGEFVSILGESGGGKSTLMNIIGGLDNKYSGEVIISGQNIKESSEKELDAYRRNTIGFIFQSFNLINYLNVLDNVLISLKMTNLTKEEQIKQATDLLKQVGLEAHMEKHPNQLSGGQKQRVAIARALAHDPTIIIADEPTGALDAQNTKEVLEILKKIAKSGKLVIVVTHSKDVANYGTYIVRLADGEVEEEERLRKPYPIKKPKKTISKPLSFPNLIKMAWNHIMYNIKRNLLITLGGAIGIFSVILMLALGSGGNGYINQQIGELVNPNSFQVMKKAENTQQPKPSEKIANQDLNELKKVAHVKNVQKGMFVSGATFNYEKNKTQTPTFQTLTDSVKQNDIKIGKSPRKNEILLEKGKAKELDKNYKKLIGKKVKLSLQALDSDNVPQIISTELTISGISDEQGSSAISYATLESMYKANNLTLTPNFINISVDKTTNVKTVQNKIKDIKEGKNAKYSITGVGAILDTVTLYINLAVYVLAAIAGISLLVSAIMVIVVLYISVSERTKEIGILRALGARRKDIRYLFVSEAFFLGLFSSILGVIGAVVTQALVNPISYEHITYNIIQISLGHAIFGVVINIIINLLAALAPSRKAAKLDPIEALTVE